MRTAEKLIDQFGTTRVVNGHLSASLGSLTKALFAAKKS